jgi:hypothetical protein
MITNSHRPVANIKPVPQTLACCMIILEEVEFRNKIPGGVLELTGSALTSRHFHLGKYYAMNFGRMKSFRWYQRAPKLPLMPIGFSECIRRRCRGYWLESAQRRSRRSEELCIADRKTSNRVRYLDFLCKILYNGVVSSECTNTEQNVGMGPLARTISATGIGSRIGCRSFDRMQSAQLAGALMPNGRGVFWHKGPGSGRTTYCSRDDSSCNCRYSRIEMPEWCRLP